MSSGVRRGPSLQRTPTFRRSESAADSTSATEIRRDLRILKTQNAALTGRTKPRLGSSPDRSSRRSSSGENGIRMRGGRPPLASPPIVLFALLCGLERELELFLYLQHL